MLAPIRHATDSEKMKLGHYNRTFRGKTTAIALNVVQLLVITVAKLSFLQ